MSSAKPLVLGSCYPLDAYTDFSPGVGSASPGMSWEQLPKIYKVRWVWTSLESLYVRIQGYIPLFNLSDRVRHAISYVLTTIGLLIGIDTFLFGRREFSYMLESSTEYALDNAKN
jgi:hypothetical protein